MYKYETHLHTWPVSKCGRAGVRETVEFYHQAGYDGIFITNHFLDGNINIDRELPYEKRIDFYFSDYEEALKIGNEIGLKVFPGVELTYGGTDFLIYGLDPEFYRAHPEIMEMDKRTELGFLTENGAFIVHAHPYREAGYIDHIRLYPRSVHAVEVINANRTDLENKMAQLYAENYGFLRTAGTDNHKAGQQEHFAGMMCETPLQSVDDFIQRVKDGSMIIFTE